MLSFWKRIVLATAILTGVFVFIALAGIAAFYAKKDQIKAKILIELNQAQQGEVSIRQINLVPFKFLPYFAVSLDSVSYFEHKAEVRPQGEPPIITVRTLITGVEYQDVFNGIFKPAALILEHGEVNLVTYADSSFNLLNALGLHQTQSNRQKGDPPTAIFGAEKEGPLGEVDIIEFIDITVERNCPRPWPEDLNTRTKTSGTYKELRFTVSTAQTVLESQWCEPSKKRSPNPA